MEFIVMKINRKLFAILAPLFLISNEKTSIIKSHYIVNNTENEVYFQIEYTLSKEKMRLHTQSDCLPCLV